MIRLSYVNLIVMGVAGLLLLALLGGAGYLGYRQGAMEVQAKWDISVLERKAGEEAALNAAAKAIAKIEVKSATYIKPLQTEIRTNTVYRECVHSADSLRNLNALITGTESLGGGLVPKANPAP